MFDIGNIRAMCEKMNNAFISGTVYLNKFKIYEWIITNRREIVTKSSVYDDCVMCIKQNYNSIVYTYNKILIQ